LNGCPLRRTCQSYVIGTKTKLDISSVKLPKHLTDAYFRRPKRQKKNRKLEGDIFAVKKEDYVVSEQRKEDQKLVDGMIMDVIYKHPEKSFMMGYLKSLFSLKTNQYPHKMVF
uniref:Large ribosomal subunit protein eL6 n=1 Tax=Soboliphyme baturini TaxID=241478 RepID=A0A183IKD2_9BILA